MQRKWSIPDIKFQAHKKCFGMSWKNNASLLFKTRSLVCYLGTCQVSKTNLVQNTHNIWFYTVFSFPPAQPRPKFTSNWNELEDNWDYQFELKYEKSYKGSSRKANQFGGLPKDFHFLWRVSDSGWALFYPALIKRPQKQTSNSSLAPLLPEDLE